MNTRRRHAFVFPNSPFLLRHWFSTSFHIKIWPRLFIYIFFLSVCNLRLEWSKSDQALFSFHFQEYGPTNILLWLVIFFILYNTFALECISVCMCEAAHAFNFAHMSSSGASQALCCRGNAWFRRRVETARDRLRFPRGDSRSWWPTWNMKALRASAPSGNTRGVRSSPHRFMMDTFPPSRSGCHEDDEWLPSASAARGGMWQPDGPPRATTTTTSSQLSPVILRFFRRLLHRAVDWSPAPWTGFQFPALTCLTLLPEQPSSVNSGGRHTS